MRTRPIVLPIILIVVLALVGGHCAWAACPGMEEFLAKVEKGTVPQSSEFPNLENCTSDFEPRLAEALLAFRENQNANRSTTTQAIEVVREGHRKAEWATAFSRLAEYLREGLRKKDLEFDPTANPSGDKFSLLDSFPDIGPSQLAPGNGGAIVHTANLNQEPLVTPEQLGALAEQVNRQNEAGVKLKNASAILGSTRLWLLALTIVALLRPALLVFRKVQSIVAGKERRTLEIVERDRHRMLLEIASKVDKRLGLTEEALKSLEVRIDRIEKPQPKLPEAPARPEVPIQANVLVQAEQPEVPIQPIPLVRPQQPDLPEMLEEVSEIPVEPKLPTMKELASEVGILRAEVEKLSETERPGTPVNDPIALEYRVLSEVWKKFNGKEVLEGRPQEGIWPEAFDALLRDLPQVVPADLKSTFDTVISPVRDYYNLTTKLSIIPKILSGKMRALEDEAENFMRLRELSQLLTMIQNSNVVADRLYFLPKDWVTDNFLKFADLFLQRYQRARLDGGHQPFEVGLQIICDVLRVADLEPIDLTLGGDSFDSTRHIGRSTICDTRFADNIIMGVVRNGFVRGGRDVIRQPEVIVNRVQ